MRLNTPSLTVLLLSLLILLSTPGLTQIEELPCTCMTSALIIKPDKRQEIIFIKDSKTDNYSWSFEKQEKQEEELIQELIIKEQIQKSVPTVEEPPVPYKYVFEDLESLRQSTDRLVVSRKWRFKKKKYRKQKGMCPRF